MRLTVQTVLRVCLSVYLGNFCCAHQKVRTPCLTMDGDI